MRTEFIHLTLPNHRDLRVIVLVETEPDGGFAIRGFEVTRTHAPEQFGSMMKALEIDEGEAMIQIEEALERLTEKEKERLL